MKHYDIDIPHGGEIIKATYYEAPNNKCIIACHGYGGSRGSAAIRHLAEAMYPHGYSTLCFDWPCHGESTSPRECFSIMACLEYLDTVIAYLKAQGKDEIYCFATSFGGFVALRYAVLHKDAFIKIVLRCPALKLAWLFGRPDVLGEGGPVITKELIAEAQDNETEILDDDLASKLLIIHGTADKLVPYVDSSDFAELNGVLLYAVQNADHRFKNPDCLMLAIKYAETHFLY